ncbi:MAG: phytoene desaturase family protein [Flavisolibacter sp.]
MRKKAIIIGAGFAGLSSAAFLAKAGWQVTVVEKNNTAGGRARQLQEKGFTFDMGPSWYWMPDVFERFFAQFDKQVSDYYSLERLDPSYRIYWDMVTMDVPADFEKLKVVFETIEPGSSVRLEAYLKEAFVKYKIGMQELVYKPALSFTEFLDLRLIRNALKLDVFTSMKTHISKYFKNKRLKQLMEFPVLFLGALPENTPALYSLMNYADMIGGTWYPQAGMFTIVKAMQEVAEDHGTDFYFTEEAKSIEIKKGRAVKLHTSRTVYEADVVVSAADYHFTEANLVPAAYRSYPESYWDKKILAPSCLMYYVGLNKKLDNVLHHSLFFDVPFDRHAKEIYEDPKWPGEPLFYLSVSSRTDNSVAPEGCENMVFLIPVASGLPGDSEELRQFYFEKIIKRLEKHTGQDIRDSIVFNRSYSVSDFTRDYHSYKGNAYGLANVLKQTAILRPSCRSKKIKNLFYAGQFTVPGPGVPPSLISGEVVARQIVKSFS